MPPEEQNNSTPPVTTPAEETKTFSADYVKALREESKGYRQRATGTEKAIRTALGLKDDEELGDVEQRIKARESSTLQTANNRLIAAELKGLEGYDQKLLAKVIDLTNVKVDDKGNVTGIKEAADAAAKEYPAVKSGTKSSFVPPNPAAGGGTTNPNQTMNDLIRGKR